MESKRKNVYIVIFVITTIVASCVALYFGITGTKEVKELQAKLDETTSNNEIQEETQEVEEKQITSNNTQVVEKIVEKAIFPKFDTTKVKSNVLKDIDSIFIRLGSPYSSAQVSNDGSVIVTYIDENNSPVNIQVDKLRGKCIDVIGGPIGDGSQSRIYFLNEDGSVEMSDLNRNITKGIASVGKINGLSNIVRICYANNNKSGIPIAIDTSGNSYNLLEY